jgi:hypothetical protein
MWLHHLNANVKQFLGGRLPDGRNHEVTRLIFHIMKTILLTGLSLFCIAFASSAADVSGKWTAQIPSRNGDQMVTFFFRVSGATLTGTTTTPQGDAPITDGTVDGDTITFTLSVRGRSGDVVKQTYTGRVRAGNIVFSRESPGGRGLVTFTARRNR